MLNINHIIIFDLLKIVSFSYQLELVVLFESTNVLCQVYLSVLVFPMQRLHPLVQKSRKISGLRHTAFHDC